MTAPNTEDSGRVRLCAAKSKISQGLYEAVRVATLIRAVYDESDGHELTEKEAVVILAKLDAVQGGNP